MGIMDIYEVELCRRGRWEQQDARFVAARDADEAAYKVTGEHLHSEGERGKVRLRVRRLGNGSPPPKLFYAARGGECPAAVPHPVARIHRHARTRKRGGPISTLYLERIGPVFDREDSALFDHDLMGRDRRTRRLSGLHMANFRCVERGSGPDAGSRGDKGSYCSQNDDLAHGVTLC